MPVVGRDGGRARLACFVRTGLTVGPMTMPSLQVGEAEKVRRCERGTMSPGMKR